MAQNNHQIVIPLSSSHWLEVTSRICTNKHVADGENPESPIRQAAVGITAKAASNELPAHEAIPENVLKVVESVHDAFSNLFAHRRTFMISTTSGFQLLRLDQILYFEYDKKKKQWVVILTDSTWMQLKRSTVADDILNYSPSFIRINQQQIINIDQLVAIDGNECRLSNPVVIAQKLAISRTYFKALQERIEII